MACIAHDVWSVVPYSIVAFAGLVALVRTKMKGSA